MLQCSMNDCAVAVIVRLSCSKGHDMATQTATTQTLVPNWIPIFRLRLWIARHREYRRARAALTRSGHAPGIARLLAREAASRIRS
jgi:saccharopine dehydrogenase-like NADP-dependent oxidoreductase